ALPRRALPATGKPDVETLRVEGREPDTAVEVVIEGTPGENGQDQPAQEFTLKVVQNGTVREEYPGLSIGRGAKSVDKVVNERSKLIRVQVQQVAGMSLAERAPAQGSYLVKPNGSALVKATPQELEGSETARTGYQGLAIADDVTMVAIPDLLTVATREDGSFDEEVYLAAQGRLVDWCEASGTRMAILDSPPGLSAQG